MSEFEMKIPRAKERYIEISGEDQYGHPKAHIDLTYLNYFSDGTCSILQELSISKKPIVHIFQHAGYVNVCLDFRSPNDADLAMFWQVLQTYSQPLNSVSYLPDELESGVYLNENGEECLVSFPMIQLGIRPFNHEMEFGITGMNPLFYTLQPNSPNGAPCVIQLTFDEEWFHVTEADQIDVDIEQLREKAAQEMAVDMLNPMDPEIFE